MRKRAKALWQKDLQLRYMAFGAGLGLSHPLPVAGKPFGLGFGAEVIYWCSESPQWSRA